MVGAYGTWLADQVLSERPPAYSFRQGRWRNVETWRGEALPRLLDRLGPVDLNGPAEVTVVSERDVDGLRIERLRWPMPVGITEAVLLRPSDTKLKLPGVLALHDHGGNKYLGWRKIARDADEPWKIQLNHQAQSYGGLAWANELARRGYVVMVHDTFPFGSRRVRVADVAEPVRYGGVDPQPDDLAGIAKYNQFAAQHEHIMAKSLFSSGTTWPGVYLVEDQRALDYLASRPEVDAERLGCGGLSGGGMRTVFLGGVDSRIACCVCVGFMTTWRDFLLSKCFTHTWMTYVPRLPAELDFPEILGLRAPRPTMVQSCTEDPLYSLDQMQAADAMLSEIFSRCGAESHYTGRFYPGGHKFDAEMQADAFAWFDQHLKGVTPITR